MRSHAHLAALCDTLIFLLHSHYSPSLLMGSHAHLAALRDALISLLHTHYCTGDGPIPHGHDLVSLLHLLWGHPLGVSPLPA